MNSIHAVYMIFLGWLEHWHRFFHVIVCVCVCDWRFKARLLEPQLVKVRSRVKVHFTDAFCGAYFTFAVSKEGHVYGFGLSNYHQLGEH